MTITLNSPISARAESYIAAVGDGLNVVNVGWTSEVKPAAAHKARLLRKVTTATVLTGVDYSTLAVNSERETGTLPWGEWAAFPYIVTHKGAEYIRVNCVPGTIRSTYFVDDVQVKRDDFLALLTPSAREAKVPTGGTITVKAQNLTIL